MVQIKSKRELEIMRRVGGMVSQVLNSLAQCVAPGVTLLELDAKAEEVSAELGAVPAFKGYMGYKHALCASVNEQVVHGIPSKRVLKEGDIVGLDFGLIYDGFYGDSAVTVPVGKVSEEARSLMKATVRSLYAGIKAARSGNTLKDVGRAIEQSVAPFGYGIVREFVGHGIGQRLHEEPQVPNYEMGASNFRLKPGMTIAIEPMVNLGKAGVKVLDDQWTAVTVDGAISAHFEHSIAITEGDPEILTDWGKPPFGGLLNQWLGEEGAF
jgi:methionyl aminopeptidase